MATSTRSISASYLSARIIPRPTALKHGSVVGHLDVLLYDDPSFFIDEKLQAEVSQLLGGKLRFQGLPLDDVRLRTLSNAEKCVSDFDIVAVDLPWIGEYATRGILMPIEDLVAGSTINRADFHPAEWEGTHSEGHQYALPLSINPEVLFYRRDMLDAAGFAPPATTDELLTAAKRLHSPREKVYGIAWTAASGTPLGQAFIQFLADFGQPVINLRRVVDGYDATHVKGEEFRPLIDTPRAREASEFMLALLEFSPPTILTMSWDEQGALFNEGRVAMMYEWATRASRVTPASPSAGNIGFVPHPVGSTALDAAPRNNILASRWLCSRYSCQHRSRPRGTSLACDRMADVTGGDQALRPARRIYDAALQCCRRPRGTAPVAGDRSSGCHGEEGSVAPWPRPPVAEYPTIVATSGRNSATCSPASRPSRIRCGGHSGASMP